MAGKHLYLGVVLVFVIFLQFSPRFAVPLFQACTDNDNCTDVNGYCRQEPEASQVCLCNSTTQYDTGVPPVCEPKVGLGVECNSSVTPNSKPCLDLSATCQSTNGGTEYQCACNDGYSESGGVCFADCKEPNVLNGDVDTTSLSAGGIANYTCNPGYVINGTSNSSITRTCINSTWSGDVPTCVLPVLDCNDLPSLDNGDITTTNTTEGGIATYTCNTGYTINGTNTRTCMNGSWSGEDLTCSPVECGSNISTVTNGNATTTGTTTYGSNASLTCNDGHESDITQVTCQTDGSWSSVNCTIKDCGSDITTITNGNATTTGPTTYESTATVNCSNGYESSITQVTCQADGSWSSVNCTIKDCGSNIDTITNGNATTTGQTTYESTASVNCNSEYESNITQVTCQADGSGLDCGSDINTVTNGTATANGPTTYGSTAPVTCINGYESNITQVTCQADGSWSSVDCTLKDCGSDINTVTNGNATANGPTTYGSTAPVTCINGYESNITQVTCQADGSWSSVDCTLKDCGSNIDTVTNGNAAATTTTTYGSSTSVTCINGYESNITQVTCQADSSWSSVNCTLKDCGSTINTVTNGGATPTDRTTFGSTATVICNLGYITTTMVITCKAAGTWSTAVCEINFCQALTGTTAYSVIAENRTEGGVATYTCVNGYTVGNTSNTMSTRTCSNGTWSGSEPNCTPVDCGNLANPDNGTVSYTVTTYQAQATYTCNTGYLISGLSPESNTRTITCTASGTWSVIGTTCTIEDCGNPNNPDNGDVSYTVTTYEAQATYTCNPGYIISGSSPESNTRTITCTASGTWSITDTTCTIEDCGNPNNPDNGDVSYTVTTYQAQATYTCNPGYIISGSSPESNTRTITCTASGTWSTTDTTCTIEDCGNPNNPDNGDVSYTVTTYQAQATYTCNPGYIISGSSPESNTRTITCTASGTWSTTDTTCTIEDCGNPNNPDNGDVSYTVTTYQAQATYTCNTGYIISGSSPESNTRTITCTASGTWSTTNTTCTIEDCGSLSNPDNGAVSYTVTTYEAQATYTCNPGYIISGSSPESNTRTITCTASGTWSITATTCTIEANSLGEACLSEDDTTVSANAQCTGDNAACFRNSTDSQSYTCQCVDGFYDDNRNDPSGDCRPVSELQGSVSFSSVTTSWMVVSWSQPADKSNFVSGYKVLWGDNSTAYPNSNSTLPSVTNFNISRGLTSGKRYFVEVQTENTVNYSDRVAITSVQREQALKPEIPGPVDNTTSNLDAEDQSITVVWNPPTGSASSYEVSLHDGDTQLWNGTSSIASVTVSFSQMKNGYRYDVRITAVSEMFNGSKVERSETYIEQIKTVVKVPSPPRSVQCEMPLDTTVTIKWLEPDFPNGDLREYKIDTYIYEGNSLKNETTGDTDLSYEITGLSPGSYYVFNVSTVNELYTSSPARLETQFCATRANVSERPANIMVSNESRSINVTWSKPPNVYGENMGYVLQVRTIDNTCVKQLIRNCSDCTQTFNVSDLQLMCDATVSSTDNQPKTSIDSDEIQTYTIAGLDPDVMYIVSVSAINAAGRGRSATVNVTTDEEVPQKPQALALDNLNTTSCTVHWNIPLPRPGDTNVRVIVDAQTPASNETKQLTGFDKRTVELNGLQEYWNYSVTVQASTSKGSNTSDPLTFQTLPAAPGQVEDFQVIRNPGDDYRKIRIEWRIPSILERNSRIIGFELHHNTSADSNSSPAQLTRDIQDTYLYQVILNVSTEVTYEFRVYAIGETVGNGRETVEYVTTPAGIPKNDFEDTDNRAAIEDELVSKSQTSFTISYNVDFLQQNYNGEIIQSGILCCATAKCNGIGETMMLDEFNNYNNFHNARGEGWPPYRVTRSNWIMQLQNNRKRRQVNSQERYTIGYETCNDTTRNQFCNGPLQDGTEYRVYLVICTNRGCLISNQYGPFTTVKAPDSGETNITVIVAVVVSVVVVAVIVVVVIFVIMRRRRGTPKMKKMESPANVLEDQVTSGIQRYRPVKLSEFESHLVAMHKDSNLQFSAAYDDLRTLAPQHPQEAANREENRLKNRYINILPFDHSRVKLNSNGEDDSSDYINANYLPGYRSPREYIGCQGPIPGTIDDMWRMVWEQNVSIIVMLTLCKEGQKVKCEQYWPDEQGEPKQYGDVVVEVISTSTIQTYIMRIFKITNGSITRTIKHFHFLSWLDFQANVKHDIILDFITHVRSHVQPPDTVGPMIVHCSAGVGRTGTYICLEHLMQFIDDHDFDVEVDIFDMVLKLRENRPLMVQTEQQYVFIHDCVKELMERKRKLMNNAMDNIYENQGFTTDENIYQNTEPSLYENIQMKTEL